MTSTVGQTTAAGLHALQHVRASVALRASLQLSHPSAEARYAARPTTLGLQKPVGSLRRDGEAQQLASIPSPDEPPDQ